VVGVLIGALACSASNRTAVERTEVDASLNSEFALPMGHTARVAASDVRVSFNDVSEDSRCPTDAQCVWEGNATVRLGVDSAGRAQGVDLKTSVRQSVTAFGIIFELRDLQPAPTTKSQIAKGDYVATLLLKR
jgi:hypothetical protein